MTSVPKRASSSRTSGISFADGDRAAVDTEFGHGRRLLGGAGAADCDLDLVEVATHPIALGVNVGQNPAKLGKEVVLRPDVREVAVADADGPPDGRR